VSTELISINVPEKEWEIYRDSVYPDGTHRAQDSECHKAFLAGCGIAMARMKQFASEMPELEAAAVIHKMYRDVVKGMEALA
jgi:hypothetical protein